MHVYEDIEPAFNVLESTVRDRVAGRKSDPSEAPTETLVSNRDLSLAPTRTMLALTPADLDDEPTVRDPMTVGGSSAWGEGESSRTTDAEPELLSLRGELEAHIFELRSMLDETQTDLRRTRADLERALHREEHLRSMLRAIGA